MQSILVNLHKSILLKSLKNFDNTLVGLDFAKVPESYFVSLNEAMLLAKHLFNYSNPNYVSLLSTQITESSSTNLQKSVELLQASHEFLPELAEKTLEDLEKVMQKCHPLEFTIDNAVKTLRVMKKGLYCNEAVEKFIEQGVLLSSFPPGKLVPQLIIGFAWLYAENRKSTGELWELVQDVMAYRLKKISFASKVSFAHAISLMDYEISQEIVKDFQSVNWKLLENEIFVQFVKATVNLKYLKGVELCSSATWENIQEKYQNTIENQVVAEKNSQVFMEKLLISQGVRYRSNYKINKPLFLHADFLVEPNIFINFQKKNSYIKPLLIESGTLHAENILLQKLGYKVLNIPDFYWSLLDENEKTTYILTVLNNSKLSTP